VKYVWHLLRLRLRKNHLYTRTRIKLLNSLPGKKTPLFSVIIPIYDRTDELKQAIQSILSQNFNKFELLLICDGSPPETLEIVKHFEFDPRVRTFYFHDNSGNPCRGRNKGIELARGKYVTFLDSDDIALPSRLEKTLYHFLSKEIDVLGGAIQYVTTGAECRNFRNGQIGYTSEQCNYDLLLTGNRLSICTVSVRTRCLRQFGSFREEMRYREDHELWLRLAYHGCTFYNTPEILAQYRIHEGNAELKYIAEDQYWFEKSLLLHKEPYPSTVTSVIAE
jgi:glycosyltransferase involved in cell wall biosynthesis